MNNYFLLDSAGGGRLNMKTRFLICLALAVSLSACGKGSSSDSDNGLSRQQQALLLQQLEKQAQEKKIEEERQRRLAEEDKQRKYLDGAERIKRFAGKLIDKVSPVSGQNGKYKIFNEKVTYDALTGTLSLPFEVSWDAIPGFNPSAPSEVHVYTGQLIMYGTAEPRFQDVSTNSVLDRALGANRNMDKFLDFVGK